MTARYCLRNPAFCWKQFENHWPREGVCQAFFNIWIFWFFFWHVISILREKILVWSHIVSCSYPRLFCSFPQQNLWGFPGGSAVKNLPASACQCRRFRLDPWARRAPGEGPVFLPEKSHGQRSLAGDSPWGCRVRHDLATKQEPSTKLLHFLTFTSLLKLLICF